MPMESEAMIMITVNTLISHASMWNYNRTNTIYVNIALSKNVFVAKS